MAIIGGARYFSGGGGTGGGGALQSLMSEGNTPLWGKVEVEEELGPLLVLQKVENIFTLLFAFAKNIPFTKRLFSNFIYNFVYF